MLTKIQIEMATINGSLINIDASLQESNARAEELHRQFTHFMEDSGRRIRDLELDNCQHVCLKESIIATLTSEVTLLKLAQAKAMGETKWHDRIWSIIQGIGIALAVIILAFILKGGTIS
jgi:ribosomal protein L16 Arg81 hydroxylase